MTSRRQKVQWTDRQRSICSLDFRNLTEIPPVPAPYANSVRDLKLSDNPLSDFEGLSYLPSLEALRCDRTSISSFRGALELPKLTLLGLKDTPVSQYEHYRIMAVIVFGDSLKTLNQIPISRQESRIGANSRKHLLLHLLRGWILTSVKPLCIYDPVTKSRHRILCSALSDPSPHTPVAKNPVPITDQPPERLIPAASTGGRFPRPGSPERAPSQRKTKPVKQAIQQTKTPVRRNTLARDMADPLNLEEPHPDHGCQPDQKSDLVTRLDASRNLDFEFNSVEILHKDAQTDGRPEKEAPIQILQDEALGQTQQTDAVKMESMGSRDSTMEELIADEGCLDEQNEDGDDARSVSILSSADTDDGRSRRDSAFSDSALVELLADMEELATRNNVETSGLSPLGPKRLVPTVHSDSEPIGDLLE
jgi:hypothetical protein